MKNCLKEIELLLYERCGVSFKQKQEFFRRHLLQAMNNFGILDCEQLFEKLQDKRVFEKFLNEFMVSQSYFYRETKHFEFLVERIEKESQIHPRILSIPCANGEEPYSIAIYLLEHGVRSFTIEAYDINSFAIEKARCGIYQKRDLSQLPLRLKERYFRLVDEGFEIAEEVRKYIRFGVCNLFEFSKTGYEFIFCRNLMIYLSEEKRKEAMMLFYEILEENGYLFLSFSDYVAEIEGFDKISLDNIYKKRV